jgi:hypothetical protein
LVLAVLRIRNDRPDDDHGGLGTVVRVDDDVSGGNLGVMG